MRFPQFEACAKAVLAKFLSFHWHGARPDARARRRESLPARTREQNNSHPLRAVRNSIVTSVRSLERPAQNPKFARNLTRPTHFGICATQQLKRPSRISPLQPPSGMDEQMRSHHTALSLSYVKNLNYKIQYFYLAQYKTACSRVAQDRASSVHAGPADARGAGLRLPLRSCREPRKVAKAGFPRSERDFAAADARSPETS